MNDKNLYSNGYLHSNNGPNTRHMKCLLLTTFKEYSKTKGWGNFY